MKKADIVEIRKSRNGRYKVLIRCLNCKTEKWVKHVTVKNGNGKFCSIACSREYKKEHPEEYRAPKEPINKTHCNNCTIVLSNKQNKDKNKNVSSGIIWGAYKRGSSLCYRCQIKMISEKLGRGITTLEFERLKEEYYNNGYTNLDSNSKIKDIAKLSGMSSWEIKRFKL